MKIHTISELGDIAGKYVLLRTDFNVQIVDGKITDTFRIEQSLPTIRNLKKLGARIAIVSHLGRPNGERNPKYSNLPVALALSELMGEPVPLVPDCIGEHVAGARRDMADGDVVLLENVRFHPGEEENNSEFSKELAHGFDIYVNDAFGVSHRAHASTVGVTKFLPSYAGELLAREIGTLSNLMENPKRPLLGLISGAKIKSKISIIKALGKLCDKIICAGGIGTSMLVAQGAKNLAMDADNLDKYDESTDIQILEIIKEYGDKIILPVEKGVAPVWAKDTPRTNKMMAEIQPGDVIMDEGPASVKEYEHAIDSAKTIVWNGTVGMAEWPPVWSTGTFALARYIADKTRAGEIESIIGGGDTVAALDAAGAKDDMTYVSTGGGAFLEFIEGRELPGIKALEK
ncbi:MAG: phosphoglycerate kinase [Rickettsiales bacterium]|jgi:phosphoglycerate kinase|nr:phosphoglycerate kinase [Rickettsiales bacterium]